MGTSHLHMALITIDKPQPQTIGWHSFIVECTITLQKYFYKCLHLSAQLGIFST